MYTSTTNAEEATMTHLSDTLTTSPQTTEEVTMTTANTTQTQALDLAKYAAQAAVLAKIAEKEAKEANKRAQEDAINAMIASGLDSVELADGTTVTIVHSDGRLVVDVEALAEIVPAKVLDNVTKRSVDLEAFKGAVASNQISKDDADKVTSLSPVADSLRITAKSKKPKI
jgi:hypothetical protein